MKKRELISLVSKKTNISERQAKQVIEAFLSAIAESAKKGDKVVIQGFGTFRVVTLSRKIARNPQTGERIEIPSYRTLRFKPCLSLKVL